MNKFKMSTQTVFNKITSKVLQDIKKTGKDYDVNRMGFFNGDDFPFLYSTGVKPVLALKNLPKVD